MICRKVKESLPDLLLAPETVSAETRAHAESCAECGRELQELRATMALMDAWEAPEVSPWFDGRLEARLGDERRAAPAGFLERLKARWTFGDKVSVRPLAAATLALMIAIGGGVYEGVITRQPVATPTASASPVIRDLQSLDENAQVFQELNSMDQQDTGDNGGNSL